MLFCIIDLNKVQTMSNSKFPVIITAWWNSYSCTHTHVYIVNSRSSSLQDTIPLMHVYTSNSQSSSLLQQN